MNGEALRARLSELNQEAMPIPGAGKTAIRHQRLMQAGREDLSLARLAEAHWDALAILEEAGRQPLANAFYGVWASEIPGDALQFAGGTISGKKMFCSGGDLIDCALVTVGSPQPLLFAIDLRKQADHLRFDGSAWKTSAFGETRTATVHFDAVPVSLSDQVGDLGWYLDRPGFWHGACGPAACWAGGALGLVDYVQRQKRDDAHTLAHYGAITASAWALQAYLAAAGDEIDADPLDVQHAQIRALALRHLVEERCSDILRRLTRAYGPRPLAMDEEVSRRYQELDLYLRQSHAERDLESLGRCLRASSDRR